MFAELWPHVSQIWVIAVRIEWHDPAMLHYTKFILYVAKTWVENFSDKRETTIIRISLFTELLRENLLYFVSTLKYHNLEYYFTLTHIINKKQK